MLNSSDNRLTACVSISGIQFAHDTTTSLSGVDLEIYDKNPSLGGTWYENRYPGYVLYSCELGYQMGPLMLGHSCTCDVPSHTYQFNWAPNPSWSSLYPPAPEILKYLEDVVNRHNLRRFMTLNTQCVLAQWNEDSSKWKVVLCDVKSGEEKTVVADVFVYAVGRLNDYKFPKIAGQEKFRGIQVHTANWPAEITVNDKRVIVIGNGASAIQCVAALQPGELSKSTRRHTTLTAPGPFSCFTNDQHRARTNVGSPTCIG